MLHRVDAPHEEFATHSRLWCAEQACTPSLAYACNRLVLGVLAGRVHQSVHAIRCASRQLGRRAVSRTEGR